MGYRVVDTDEVEPAPGRPCEKRDLSAAAGLASVALNRFLVAPGEQIPLAYHYHERQEEAFYVLSGTLSVETPEETFVLGPADLLVVDPESPQRAYNPADADATADVLALGAPPADDDARKYEP